MTIYENYKVDERSNVAIEKHGSIEKAIIFLKTELEEFESSWSKYSCDCLGQGITCNRLLITNLKSKLNYA